MFLIALLIACFLLIPSSAFAWGPLTHMYLGTEIYYLGSLLPPAVYSLIRKYRQDYLYGNIMADIILGKKYMPKSRHSHSWDVGIGLLQESGADSEKAFSLGYLSHLAADTVAHGRFMSGRKNMEHAMLELRADSFIDRGYGIEALAIDKEVQSRNDALLGRYLDMVMFSFKTNKRILKGALVLSRFNNKKVTDLLTAHSSPLRQRKFLDGLHDESLDRIVDVLRSGTRSEVLKKCPIGKVRRGRVLSAILS